MGILPPVPTATALCLHAAATPHSPQGGHNGGVNEGKLQLFEFLRGLAHKGRALLVNPVKVLSLQQLQQALLRGDRYLDEFDDEVSSRGPAGGGRA